MSENEARTLITLCLATDAYEFHDHFVQRLDERGLFFSDVLLIADHPTAVRLDGEDEFLRQRVLLRGGTSGGEVELLVCLEPEPFCEFITIYWM